MKEFLRAAAAAGLNGKVGKQAIKREHRNQVTVKDDASFTGSVDLDAHFEESEPNACRWDYGVGFNAGGESALWIEAHPASGSGEVAVVLRKLKWLKDRLKTPAFQDLANLTRAAQANGEVRYRWLYKGKTSFRRGGMEQKRLAKEGMRLPERYIRLG